MLRNGHNIEMKSTQNIEMIRALNTFWTGQNDCDQVDQVDQDRTVDRQ